MVNSYRSTGMKGTDLKRYLLLCVAWICLGFGAIGVVIPVMPTTPFLLLAAFLFARSSPRIHQWMLSTRLYQSYVVPFKESGGITAGKKARILAISLSALAISAALVQKPLVWAILSCCAAFLLYLVFIRIPTIPARPEPVTSREPGVSIEG